MADARLDHVHAGTRQALGDLFLQVLGNFLRMAAQRDLAILVLVVGIAGRHRAQRRFGLDVDIAFVVIDVVDRLGRIHHLPHDHRRDLDRAAFQFVDLELAAFEVAHPQRHLPGREERIVPAQPAVLDRAHVLAEQAQHRRLVGFHRIETGQRHQQHHASGHRQQHQQQALLPNPQHEQRDHPDHTEQHRQQHRNPRQRTSGNLLHGTLRICGKKISH